MNSRANASVICFLQGLSGFFFWRLSRELTRRGIRTLRINICAEDSLNWPGPSTPYRGRPENWGAFIERFFVESNVTQLMLLGKQREYHRIAIDVAHKLGITVVVSELGYLRPDWLTLELDGMSGNSRFPRDPQVIRKLAKGLSKPKLGQIYRNSFAMEAISDVSFHLANMAFWFLYPHYRSHLLGSLLLGHIGIGLHLLKSGLGKRKSHGRVRDLSLSGQPFFVFPLQIENDFQIRAYSPYRSISDALTEVMISFAKHAPPESVSVIKDHPCEIAWLGWRRYCPRLASELNIRERICIWMAGRSMSFSPTHRGLSQSTAHPVCRPWLLGRPLKVLSQAVFNLEGLAFSGSLDPFWSKPVPSAPDLRDDFISLLSASTQVRGGFYSAQGSRAAINEIANRLLTGQVNISLRES